MENRVAVLGGGMAGALVALELAEAGSSIVLFEAAEAPLTGASVANEGKIHLGFVYGADPTGRTTANMIDGALQFRPILERWIPSRELARATTAPFTYYVPPDSLLTPDAVEAHFHRVAGVWAQAESRTGQLYLGHRRGAGWARIPAPDGMAAAYTTEERAIDPRPIAGHLAEALLSHPRIELRPRHHVRQAARQADGRLAIHARDGETTRVEPGFDTVVNAAWNGRRAIDAASGHVDAAPHISRFKMNVRIPAKRARDLSLGPNFTAIIGEYGDLVQYRTGEVYFSWYPAGMLASAVDEPLFRPVLSPARAHDLIAATAQGLAQFDPGCAALPAHATTDDLIGDFIVARGRTDIDDRNSELHQRFRTGAARLADGYFSIDTGKYTLAPLAARTCADMIRADT